MVAQITNGSCMAPYTKESVEVIQEKIQEEKTVSNSDKTSKYYKYLFWEFEEPLKWNHIIFFGSIHLITVASMLFFPYIQSFKTVLFQIILSYFSGFGITGGAHRYWTHRTYKATTPMKYFLMFCYALAGQNTVFEWVRDHRVHHKFSETSADPHDSNRGFFFAHIGWLLMKKKRAVIEKGNSLDFSDITNDKTLMSFCKNFGLIRLVFCFILPTLIPIYFWNESFNVAFFGNLSRFTVNLNITWSVNSWAHLYGNHPFDKNINPAENLYVSIAAMGEGWHNYHHTFPWDYRCAELGQKFNITTLFLDFFASIGWVYDLRYPSESLVSKTIAKLGDGTHHSLQEQEEPAKEKSS